MAGVGRTGVQGEVKKPPHTRDDHHTSLAHAPDTAGLGKRGSGLSQHTGEGEREGTSTRPAQSEPGRPEHWSVLPPALPVFRFVSFCLSEDSHLTFPTFQREIPGPGAAPEVKVRKHLTGAGETMEERPGILTPQVIKCAKWRSPKEPSAWGAAALEGPPGCRQNVLEPHTGTRLGHKGKEALTAATAWRGLQSMRPNERPDMKGHTGWGSISRKCPAWANPWT